MRYDLNLLKFPSSNHKKWHEQPSGTKYVYETTIIRHIFTKGEHGC